MRTAINRTHLSRNDERNRLDCCASHLVCTANLALGYLHRTSRKEAHTALRLCRFVLRYSMERVRFIFIVADVAISDQNLSARTTYTVATTNPLPATAQ